MYNITCKKKKTTQIKFHKIFYLFTLQKGPWKQWKDLIQIYETTRFLNSLTLHTFFLKMKKKIVTFQMNVSVIEKVKIVLNEK